MAEDLNVVALVLEKLYAVVSSSVGVGTIDCLWVNYRVPLNMKMVKEKRNEYIPIQIFQFNCTLLE